jgi:hypothetical protein
VAVTVVVWLVTVFFVSVTVFVSGGEVTVVVAVVVVVVVSVVVVSVGVVSATGSAVAVSEAALAVPDAAVAVESVLLTCDATLDAALLASCATVPAPPDPHPPTSQAIATPAINAGTGVHRRRARRGLTRQQTLAHDHRADNGAATSPLGVSARWVPARRGAQNTVRTKTIDSTESATAAAVNQVTTGGDSSLNEPRRNASAPRRCRTAPKIRTATERHPYPMPRARKGQLCRCVSSGRNRPTASATAPTATPLRHHASQVRSAASQVRLVTSRSAGDSSGIAGMTVGRSPDGAVISIG